MNKIPIEIFKEIINEADIEQGSTGFIELPIEDVLERLIEKGWKPYEHFEIE